jgi:hypothetical protein
MRLGSRLIRRFLCRPLEEESWVGILLGNVPPHLQPTAVSDPWLGSELYPVSLGRTLRREFGSFLRRIRYILETQLYGRGVRVDFQNQLGLTRQESMRAEDVYNEDSSNLFARFPWLTLADERIFFEGWTKGATWAYRNARK